MTEHDFPEKDPTADPTPTETNTETGATADVAHDFVDSVAAHGVDDKAPDDLADDVADGAADGAAADVAADGAAADVAADGAAADVAAADVADGAAAVAAQGVDPEAAADVADSVAAAEVAGRGFETVAGSGFDAVAGGVDEVVEDSPAGSVYTDDELLGAATASPIGDTGDIPDPTRHEPDSPPHAGAGGSTPPGEPPPGGSGQPPPPNPPPQGSPPPAGHYGPAPRRLYRSNHDRKVGGVSAGIAEYFGIDPTLVRLGTLAAAITGVGLLIYIAAWIIVPLRPEGFAAQPQRPSGDMTLAFGIGALALAFGIVTGSWSIFALALIGGGVWLLSEHTALSPAAPGSYQPAAGGYPAAPQAYAPTPYPQTDWPTATPAAPDSEFEASSAPGAVPPPLPRPAKKRGPQRITWTVLSLLALLAAVGIAASSGDWWSVSATRFLGIGVVITGIGVVVGQFKGGGARGLIPLGILGAIALFPVSAVDGLLDEGIGESFHRPATFEELEATYEHGIGELRVDLSRLDFEGQSETIDIELGIGELVVIVPGDVGGQAMLEATAGEISYELPDSRSLSYEDGINIESGTIRLEGSNGTLDLNIDVGLGVAELRTRGN